MLKQIRNYSEWNQIRKFPKPKIISFDGFGTLYTPKEPISVQYSKLVSEFGITKAPKQIESQFGDIFKRLWQAYPNYGKTKGWNADRWWSELIIELFELKPNEQRTKEICGKLLTHFTSQDSYELYKDVIPLLKILKEKGVRLIIASNSDSRIVSVLNSLKISEYFGDRDVFISYDLDYQKPQKEFYEEITKRLLAQGPGSSESLSLDKRVRLLESIWHIGDEDVKDKKGAVQAGWNAILVDRDNSSGYLKEDGSTVCIASSVQKQDSQVSPDDPVPQNLTKDESSSSGLGSKEIKLLSPNQLVVRNLETILELFEMR